ncbi:hypothetical protein CDAR_463671 [Caerostris darwini]|uniref:Secreted protein n=1 Tax=Caerostris darwini TaxID=1538125 RepID=A0AAV4N1C4_9ARAC|nr:hypothetical protein CDAR_463671 [Caerostris darwini]
MVFIGCVLYNLLPCEPHVTEEIYKKKAQWETKHRLSNCGCLHLTGGTAFRSGIFRSESPSRETHHQKHKWVPVKYCSTAGNGCYRVMCPSPVKE